MGINILLLHNIQIFQINNKHRQCFSYSHPPPPFIAAIATHDDDDDACIAKIIIIFRSQCEVEICGKFMSE